MGGEIAATDIARLEALVGDDPGSPGFPALAEAHRTAGRAKEGERVARAGLERRPEAVDGRVALGLALLDLGRLDEARAELERALEAVCDHPLARAALEPRHGSLAPAWDAPPPPAPAADHLLERIGEPEIEAAFDQAAPETEEMVSADSVAQRAVLAAEFEGPDEPEALPVATRTVAELLEQQGHPEDAEIVRASIGDPGADERTRIIVTLERWLENLRRGRS